MSPFAALLRAEIRVFTRDKMMLFFTLLFPLVFILLFGFLMGGIGDMDETNIGILLETASDHDLLMQALRESGLTEPRDYDSQESLEAAISEQQVDFGLIWNGSTLQFLYNTTRLQENSAFQQLAAGIAADFNILRQGTTSAIGIVQIHAGEIESTGWFNLVLPGILAFSILSSGLFAISGHLTQMKERNILDRMIVTPMRPVSLLAAVALVRLVVGFISTLITLGVGILVFHLSFTVDWFRYSVFVVCSTLGTMGIGTLIALVVRRPSSASSLANALAMTMMFLAGIYFPIEFMPPFLRTISALLPLTHMANVMRYVTGVMDMSDARFWITSAVFLGLALVLFPVTARYVVRPLRR
jgi:ABC-2 type transport system permease protein